MSENNLETAFPLTPLQEGMLYHSIRHPESAVYHGQCSMTLSGPMDDGLFRRAWELAAERHQAFRTFYAWEKRDRPLQVVQKRVELGWLELDWSRESPSAQERLWSELLKTDQDRGFDMASAPVMRFVLVHLGEEQHRFLWSLHHALADGWSGMLVMKEVLDDYNVLKGGADPDRPLPPSFATFITWLDSRDTEIAETYWREELGGFIQPTPLPGVSRQKHGNSRVMVEVVLDARATPALHASAARFRVTPNTIAVGAWALVLDRYATHSDEVVFGVTLSERPPEIEGVDHSVGLYLSTVPVRITVRREQLVGDWLSELQGLLSDGRDQSAGGLGEIQRWSELERKADLARSLVVYESFPPHVVTHGAGTLKVDATSISAPSDLPLALLIYPDERLTLQLVYDPELFDESAAKRILGEASRTLMALTEISGGQLKDINVIDPDVRRLMIEEWSGAHLDPPVAPDVLELFETHAAASPEATAVRTREADISYGDLDQAANLLAHRVLAEDLPGTLRSSRTEVLLGIPANRSIETVVAVLAALKCGYGYTLFDADQPKSRLDEIIGHIDCVLVELDDSSPWDSALKIDLADEGSSLRPDVAVSSSAMAYVIWTSGSTGTPKGVVVERGHLARSTAARLDWYDETPGRFLLLSSLAVDSAVAGLFWTLCTGGCLIIPPHHAEQELHTLARLMQEETITTALMVPSLYRTLLDEIETEKLESLRLVVVAGESCPASLVAEHRNRLPNVRLYNEYGPSEATVWATATELSKMSEGVVTIGRPIPFVRLYLLDESGRLVPIGASGEICLGGDTVARGYLGQDELTDMCFINDPFSDGNQMYRTGDVARFLADGRIEFLGRMDHQIKIRGFRVEPGEIERVLEAHSEIKEAAVILEPVMNSADIDVLLTTLLERAGPDAESYFSDLIRGG